MTKQIILAIGACYGFISVVLGALGSHALKGVLSPEKLESFEVAVRYQMYHALFLLLIGFLFSFHSVLEKTIGWCAVLGTLLFSGSIYLLCMAESWKVNLKFLGPITPLGGLLLIVAWACLVVWVFKGARI
ncbi:MAG: DUF423 domain-containing protein [Dysgonamonadaceae bacterium]